MVGFVLSRRATLRFINNCVYWIFEARMEDNSREGEREKWAEVQGSVTVHGQQNATIMNQQAY